MTSAALLSARSPVHSGAGRGIIQPWLLLYAALRQASTLEDKDVVYGELKKIFSLHFFTPASYLLARVSATEILVGRKVRHYVRKLHLVITFAYFR